MHQSWGHKKWGSSGSCVRSLNVLCATGSASANDAGESCASTIFPTQSVVAKTIEASHLAVKTGVVRLRVGDFVLASQFQGLFSLRLENAKRKSLNMLRLTLREYRTTQLLRWLNSPHVEITSSFALAEPVAPADAYVRQNRMNQNGDTSRMESP